MKTFLLFLSLLAFTFPASAQPGPNRTGVGLVLGNPSGLSLKFYQAGRSSGRANALDFAASWDFDSDFLFLQGHYLWEQSLQTASPTVRFFYGPGLFIGVRDDARGDEEMAFGGSANIGLALWAERFEFFLQANPRLELVPATDADVGAGIGVRFYF